jgi:cobyrinic acid a,c-diamide synthase
VTSSGVESRAAQQVPRVVIAGTASNVGKTTIASALIRALVKRGMRVAAFKCGPDYLDPSYLSCAASGVCHNLDGWMMGRAAVVDSFDTATSGADIAVIEGVMGLFDGADPRSDVGSTAEVAKWLNAPVLLVTDCSGMARSAAAMVQGYCDFDRALRVVGVLCNRVGSKSHYESLKAAITRVPVLGALPKRPELTFPSRHLGLHRASDASAEHIEQWAMALEEWCDIDAIAMHARSVAFQANNDDAADDTGEQRQTWVSMSPPRCRIGVAWDAAFQFYYEHNLRSLERAGAELVRFSPIADATLPDVDGLYLGGGYPELCAESLAANSGMLAALREASAFGMPIYAECGGLMYLCANIQSRVGTFPMVGVFPATAVLKEQRVALGYASVTTRRPTILGDAGTAFRGHQFRYSDLEWEAGIGTTAYELTVRRTGNVSEEGFVCNSTLGSYVHAHWGSNPDVPGAFVAACVQYGERRR